MFINQSYQKIATPQYVEALLHCSERKVCTNLAKTINRSHDFIYEEMARTSRLTNSGALPLERLAYSGLNPNETYLIFDDTHLTKLYARLIEGLDVGFDGAIGQGTLGLKFITSLLTDKTVSIPVEAMPYIGKELAQAGYATKSDIAIDVTKHIVKLFKIKRLLADAHFATNTMIDFLSTIQVNYLMKISRSRLVTIGKETGQLKNILRLKKNNRVKCAKGVFNGIDCFFYVIKVKNGSTVYFISNDQIDPYEVVALYKIRWNIELFHRTAKQYLGLKDCQMRSIEKQRQHVLFVMQAYALASIQRAALNLSCVEDVINNLRDVKLKGVPNQKFRPEGNFDCVA